MPRNPPPTPDAPVQRELRRLGWALVIYGMLVLGLGVWAVRLGMTHRRFAPLPVTQAVDSVEASAGEGRQDSAPEVEQVRGEVP